MPRKPLFRSYTPTRSERRAARSLCGKMSGMRYSHEGRELLAQLFDPIERSVIPHLLTDIAHGTGYQRSALACIIDHKAYYLRKRHLLWCLAMRMSAQLAAEREEVMQDG